MRITDFLNLYSKDSFFDNIIHSIQDNTRLITINGLNGSMISVLSAICYQKDLSNQIIVLPSKEEAEYYYTDMLNLNSGKNVFFFPELTNTNFNDNYNLLSRTEIINLTEKDNFIITTYPEAFFKKISIEKNYIENTIVIKKNQKLSLQNLRKDLIAKDFKKVDTITEPGEYSIRGGIVDIFSYAKQEPVRIEFFGEEIESIRVFDLNSQISFKEIDEIKIAYKINEKESENISFFNLFSEKTLLLFKNFETILHEIEDNFNTSDKKENDYSLYESEQSFLNSIKNKKRVNISRYKSSDIEYNSTIQGSYNNNFDILINELKEYQDKEYKIVIASEHFKYSEEIKKIINEKDSKLLINTIKLGLYKGFIDNILKIVCFTDHQILGRFYQHKHKKKSISKNLTLKELYNLNIGDYVVHVDHGIGQFSGIHKIKKNDNQQEVIKLSFLNNDLVYVNVQNIYKISKYSNKEGKVPKLSLLGSKTWENKKKKVKKKIQDIAEDLIKLYSERKKSKGFEFKRDDVMQIAMESSFIYEETPDQLLAINKVKEDMEKSYPMDRLICGDVGFGKTEIAMRAAFKAVNSDKQVAVLAPTTILTLQHYKTFKNRFKKFPIVIEYINRFRTTKEKNQIIKELKKGQIDILIGTHGIINKKVVFKDLGLLIIDEEQKFGVKTKEQIKKLKVSIDVLTLTATPIPRTLQFSLMGARDLSIISTPPPNRQPIETKIIKFKKEIIKSAIESELLRNGQVFFVHNRIKDIEEVASFLRQSIKNSNVGVAHGQMESKNLENILLKFVNGEYDILVSTNIIESGLDIPNANTIFINNAHNFGLSDLHQMRGRTGRSNKKAYCYLVIPTIDSLTPEAKKRISALEELSDIGDGFKIAMRDLDIRGAGNLLGGEQSGFIEDIGYELYHKILDETIGELKQEKYKNIFDEHHITSNKECLIETDLDIFIPEDYIPNESERINTYIRIDKIEKEADLNLLKDNLRDRYGMIPEPLLKLLKLIPIRSIAIKKHIQKAKLKNNILKIYFDKDILTKKASQIIDNILKAINNNPDKFKFKETEKYIILSILRIPSLEKCLEALIKI